MDILDDIDEGCLTPLIKWHNRPNMCLFVGGLSDNCDNKFKQFDEFFNIIIFGDFKQIYIFCFDPLIDGILKVLLDEL